VPLETKQRGVAGAREGKDSVHPVVRHLVSIVARRSNRCGNAGATRDALGSRKPNGKEAACLRLSLA
jgi:hypothetical protein